jgi:hypothetical protein
MTKEERRIRDKEYYQRNKEKYKEYFTKNKEKINAKNNERRRKHKEQNSDSYKKTLQMHRRYVEKNKEKCIKNSREYYQKNKEKILAKCKAYQENNKEAIKQTLKKYYSNPETYKLVREKDRVYGRKRAQEIKLGVRPKPEYINTTQNKIKQNLRNRLLWLLNKKNITKTNSALSLLGCTIEEFIKHIEQQFLPGMTWGNRGVYKSGHSPKWHFDHIIPCSAFDLSDIEQQKKCFHYSNIRPLWGLDNIKKGGIKKTGD